MRNEEDLKQLFCYKNLNATLPVRLFSLKSLVGEDGFVDLAGLFRSTVSSTCIFCRHSASIGRFSDHIEKFHWNV